MHYGNLYQLYIPAGWSSLVARQAHNLKVLGSNPSPAPKKAVSLKLTAFTIYEYELFRVYIEE